MRHARSSVLAVLLSLPSLAHAADVPVSDAATLLAAIAAAKAGDTIILADGTYKLPGASCGAAGTPESPIVVRGASPLGAKIEFDGVEGFKVSGPSWRFEGLDIRGTCANDSDCEHAFHVSGKATGFVMRGNRVHDFNAQLKVNAAPAGAGWDIPHGGLVEGNELFDAHPRDTGNPVTKLNIDTGDGWVVRANFIHDHHKGGGDGVSYGAFMKSGGKGGLFERNLVICSLGDTSGGTRIGLSFGGGGTAPQFCSPAFDAAVPCDPEHTDGVIRNNVLVACSDVGIYLNKAKNTSVLYNTLIATAGIDFRFASTTGEADGNVLASKIRMRDGGTFTAGLNLTELAASDFDGWYLDPLAGDLRKKGDLAQLLAKGSPRPDVSDDYCARARGGPQLTLGALEHTLGDCVTNPPTSGEAAGGAAGAGSAGAGGASAGGAGGGSGQAGSGAAGTGGASAGSGGASAGSGGASAGSGGASAGAGGASAGAGGVAAGGAAGNTPGSAGGTSGVGAGGNAAGGAPGIAGKGGASAGGNTSAGDAGSAGAGGAPAAGAAPGAEDEGGCGCRAAGGGRSSPLAAAALLPLLALALRSAGRRRSRRAR
jgi:hypothetical protein